MGSAFGMNGSSEDWRKLGRVIYLGVVWVEKGVTNGLCALMYL